MKIALPVHNGFINDHFGHADKFVVYIISPEKNIESVLPVASLEGCGCRSGIAQVLAEQGVSILLAGKIGTGAINHLNAFGIEVVRGCYGQVDFVVNEFLKGTITDSEQTCAPHEGCDKH
jgi:predicted Fe-Mo cluster-binding NifX family protein